MKLNLREDMIQFLADEFDLSEADLLVISKNDWNKIREKCFFIECDETLESCSERGELASDIASLKFSELFSETENVRWK